MTLGQIIKEYRKENYLSQRKFAALCGVSNGYISMLEEGKNPKTNEPIIPSLVTLQKLAEAMEMSLDDLMAIADEMPISLSHDPAPTMNLQLFAEAAPARDELTEAEQLLLNLFRQIPEEKQQLFLQMGRLYADSLKKD